MFYGIVFQGAPKHMYIYIYSIYVYMYWSLTFLSLSGKLDMYPKSDVLSSTVRLKYEIFKMLYIIFTHTHLYIPLMLLERTSKKLFLLDCFGVPRKNNIVVSGRSGSSRNPRNAGPVHIIPKWITHGVTSNFKGPMENGCGSKLKSLSGTTIGHHWPTNSSSQGAQHISGLKMIGSEILEVKHGKTVSRLEMTMVF